MKKILVLVVLMAAGLQTHAADYEEAATLHDLGSGNHERYDALMAQRRAAQGKMQELVKLLSAPIESCGLEDQARQIYRALEKRNDSSTWLKSEVTFVAEHATTLENSCADNAKELTRLQSGLSK